MPESQLINVILPAAVGSVAFLYSSVGHGGATGYLAVAALLGLAPAVARPGALWMNCAVAGIAFWRFQRAGCFDGKVFGQLAIASIPCAWLGSQVHLNGRVYGAVLALVLGAAGVALFTQRRREGGAVPGAEEKGIQTTQRRKDTRGKPGWPLAMAAGGGLGFLAGITGIGGGVFLTPFLILLDWTPAKVAGGISALFILVNSLAGLAGLGGAALVWQPVFIWAILLGIVGAMAGTHLGVQRWQSDGFRRALAAVLWIAAGKLVLTGR